MKVLITGSTGFIGRKLKIKLIENSDIEIVEFNRSNGGDISEKDALKKYYDTKIDHVVHLAANTFVPQSWEAPLDFFSTNSFGTMNVLELCRKTESDLTFVSSYLYGAPKRLPIIEEDLVQSNNPYAFSKDIAEQACLFYSKHYDVQVTIVRPFNVYGPGQSEIFLIPSIIRQIHSEDRSEIQVKILAPKRDYIFVDDLVALIQKTIVHKSIGTSPYVVVNAGTGTSYSVGDVIRIAKEVTASSKPIVASGEIRKNEVMDTVADITKASSHFDWTPKYTLKEGIQKIVEKINEPSLKKV